MRARLVITGVTGFLGSALLKAMTPRPDLSVVAFVRSATTIANSGIEAIEVELTDQEVVERALRHARPDFVIHVAGRVSGSALELYRDNTVTTIVLAEAILAACPQAILTAFGSAAEYGHPTSGERLAENMPCRPVSIYGHSKVTAATYLAASASKGLRYNLLRIFNVVGRVNSTAQVLGTFIAKAISAHNTTRIVELGRLDAVRDFIAVDDIIRTVSLLIEKRICCEVMNVCSGNGRRVRDLIQYIIQHSAIDFQVVERGNLPSASPSDVMIGDPARFRTIANIGPLTSIEETLAAAWDLALADKLSHHL